MIIKILPVLAVVLSLHAFAGVSPRVHEIWETGPAPNNGSNWASTKSDAKPKSYDKDWEQWSYPVGNGYVGASVFGRTDTERIQITDKTLHNKGIYGNGGLTNFAEVYLDLNHKAAQNYRRSLNLNEAIAHVSYKQDGVAYKREYFASYPDNMIVVRLTADQKGALSFAVRAEIPYLDAKDRTGTITSEGNVLTLKGTIPHFNCNYEGQIKVLNEGGSVTADPENATIKVDKADAVTLLIATGTNYRINAEMFQNPAAKKLDPNQFPHDEVTSRIDAAQSLGYAALKERHLKDYQKLFGRVSVNLNSTPSPDPTHLLLEKYKKGEANTWLEELMFQHGRYLLIASSREKSLPANLQGAWSAYQNTPWSGGFWHNINVQMNYWGAMSANLGECFEAYNAFFKAYLPVAQKHAADYVRKHNPGNLSEGGDNGWIIGTGANAYYIPGASGGHSGPGTGGFTAKLLVDYYLFTQDQKFLEEVAYPAMLSLSKFYSKALVPHGEFLLVEPSASPEQQATPEQIERITGRAAKGKHFITAGCAFDQGFVWETFSDTLALAKKLGKPDPFLETIREQMGRLDPIQVGADGQIKEYREETHYSDIGDPKHRHISHLCPLYPGTLIGSAHPEWMKAASKTLDLRGNKTTGWALAHRMNSRARLGEGERAHEVYQRFLRERTLPNLWTVHPPFQIDANLGTMAGVVEMLLQSHEGAIKLLPALPKAWNTGSFQGLVARGNFVVSCDWSEGKPTAISIQSKSGGTCRIASPGIGAATLKDGKGHSVKTKGEGSDLIEFETTAGETYAISKPNVIIILVDDLGYGDVKCYNPERGKIPTPNIDKLASQGMRFTDAHTSSGVCSPSRYALLTGRYHWRSRLQSYVVNYLQGPLIAPGRLTLASLLKQHGYRTGAIGKWHLGWDFQLTADERKRLQSYGGKMGAVGKVKTAVTDEDLAAWRTIYARQFRGGPVTCGFDSYFGTDVPNWPPYGFIENDRTVGIPSELLATDTLRNNQADVQGPALAGWKLEDVLPALEERACAFIQNAAKAPEPFFLYLPLTAPHTPIATTKEWRGKSGLNDYADFVMQTDATIGRVLQALEESGAAQNTLVVFTSDNGFAPYVGAVELEEKGHFPSGPLRGYKGDAWEGGHRVPFIVRWPGKVKPDTRCDALVAQADLMATLAETLDAKLPDNAGEDSFSLMPLLQGGNKPVREYAISHGMNGLPALRKGSWKIIFGQKGGGFTNAPGTTATGQLYDLATDLGETKNLWNEQPELVAELTATMTRLVADGRSTPGEQQQNDVPVRWQRFIERSSPAK